MIFSRRLLTRRDVLRTGLAVGAGWVLGGLGFLRTSVEPSALQSWPLGSPAQPLLAAPACVVRPEQTEGPYFVDGRLNRSDIRSDPSDGSVRPGVPLRLVFNVSRIEGGACLPLAGALVDVWHCDALRGAGTRVHVAALLRRRGWKARDTRGPLPSGCR